MAKKNPQGNGSWIRPDWKVYRPNGSYTAATKHPVEAAVLVAFLGEGATIRYKHHTLAWTEGKEKFRAAASYDQVTQVCYERVMQARNEAMALQQGFKSEERTK